MAGRVAVRSGGRRGVDELMAQLAEEMAGGQVDGGEAGA